MDNYHIAYANLIGSLEMKTKFNQSISSEEIKEAIEQSKTYVKIDNNQTDSFIQSLIK